MNGTSEMEWIDSYARVDEMVSRVAAIREGCGKDFSKGIDFHVRVHKTMAKIIINEVAPFGPLFVEEPVLVERFEYFREFKDFSMIPVATGERMYSR